MTTATVPATRYQTKLWSWVSLRNPWQYFLTALALLGLVDVTKQLVEWAALIHWFVEHYATLRTWLFNWSPIHFPPEWHNYIVLGCVMFSITNIGYWRRTGRTYLFDALTFGFMRRPFPKSVTRLDMMALVATVAFSLIFMVSTCAVLMWFCMKVPAPLFWCRPLSEKCDSWAFLGYLMEGLMSLPRLTQSLLVAAFILGFTGPLIAWRWILSTTLLFVALVSVNEIYVHWLAPMASGVGPG